MAKTDFTTIERYVLEADTERGRAGIKSVAKELRQLERHERDLAKVNDHLAASSSRAAKAAEDQGQAFSKAASSSKNLLSTFTDYKSVVDVATGQLRRFAAAVDETLTRGTQFANVQKALTIDINDARAATKGLVTDMTLMTNANKAAALGIDLTSEAFASLAEGAVVMSQKLGIDANYAFESLITGIARKSIPILDNLGLNLKGVSQEALTLETVVEKLNEAVGETTVRAEGAGAVWARLKVVYENTKDAASATVATTDILTGAMDAQLKGMDIIVQKYVEWYGVLTQVSFALAGVHAAMPFEFKGQAAMPDRPSWLSPLSRRNVFKGTREDAPSGGKQRKARPFGGRSPTNIERTRDPAIVAEEMAAEARAIVDREGRRDKAAADAKTEAAIDRRVAGYRAEFEQLTALNDQYKMVAVDGLAQFAGGLWLAADAAIQSGEGMGKAVAMMTKQVLLGIASQATVKALFELAEGLAASAAAFFNPAMAAKASMHYAAAAKFGAVASVAGAVGLGISAGTAGGGGGGGAHRGGGAASRSTPRSGGGSRRQEQQKTVVEVFFGDSRDRGAILLQRRETSARAA